MSDDLLLIQVSVEDQLQFKRLDQFLAARLPHLSRSFIKKLFEEDMILFDEESPTQGKLTLSKLPKTGSLIAVDIPPPIPTEAQAENLPLDIIYEDEHLLFVNKAAGMVTHPAPGNYTGTLVNAVLYHCKDLKGIGGELRPGIVHRLDKGTSGIMVVAKSAKCHEGLIELFSRHDIDRIYEAILIGGKNLPSAGRLESTIGRSPTHRQKMAANVKNGRKAVTHYHLLKNYEKFTHMQFKLETGRTHQIRVHASQLLHHALLMDPLYGNPAEHLKHLGEKYLPILKDYPHPLLHARVLGLVHPITGEKLRFEVEPPQIFKQVLELQ